jgi:hypothetical protein
MRRSDNLRVALYDTTKDHNSLQQIYSGSWYHHNPEDRYPLDNLAKTLK